MKGMVRQHRGIFQSKPQGIFVFVGFQPFIEKHPAAIAAPLSREGNHAVFLYIALV